MQLLIISLKSSWNCSALAYSPASSFLFIVAISIGFLTIFGYVGMSSLTQSMREGVRHTTVCA